MGNSTSRQRDANSGARQVTSASSSSRRAPASAPASTPPPVASSSAARRQRPRRTGGEPELVVPSSWRAVPAPTREQLERRRRDFWETRLSGDAAVWETLRGAMESIFADLALAKTIMASAGLKPAAQGEDGSRVAVYDTKGALYEVPLFCCRDPVNMAAGASGGEVHIFMSGGELPDERIYADA